MRLNLWRMRGLLMCHARMALSTMRAAMTEWQKAWAIYMPVKELRKCEKFMLMNLKDFLS
jgi:hypothetical protein